MAECFPRNSAATIPIFLPIPPPHSPNNKNITLLASILDCLWLQPASPSLSSNPRSQAARQTLQHPLSAAAVPLQTCQEGQTQSSPLSPARSDPGRHLQSPSLCPNTVTPMLTLGFFLTPFIHPVPAHPPPTPPIPHSGSASLAGIPALCSSPSSTSSSSS